MTPETDAAPPHATILVVDDDPIFSGLAAACLERAGFRVVVAADGVEGLEQIDREPIDLLIVDLSMPRIDGFRMIALVRGSQRLQRLAIMVVSSRHDAEAFREALAIGADAIQTKPIDWSLLPERSWAVITQKRAGKLAGAPEVARDQADALPPRT